MSEKAKSVVYKGRGWSLLRIKNSSNLYVVASEKGKPRLYEPTGTGSLTEAMSVGKEKYKAWQRSEGEVKGRHLLIDGWNLLNASRLKLIAVGDLQETTH